MQWQLENFMSLKSFLSCCFLLHCLVTEYTVTKGNIYLIKLEWMWKLQCSCFPSIYSWMWTISIKNDKPNLSVQRSVEMKLPISYVFRKKKVSDLSIKQNTFFFQEKWKHIPHLFVSSWNIELLAWFLILLFYYSCCSLISCLPTIIWFQATQPSDLPF